MFIILFNTLWHISCDGGAWLLSVSKSVQWTVSDRHISMLSIVSLKRNLILIICEILFTTLSDSKKQPHRFYKLWQIIHSRHRKKKLQDLLQKVGKESEKNQQGINCKKTEWIAVSERNNPRCNVPIGYTIIKLVRQFKYQGRP